MISETIQFIMDELRNPDNGITQLCDNQIFSGMPRIPSTLIAPHYTRIGVEYSTESGDGYFFTPHRDFDNLDIKVKILVSSAYGENENYCRDIMEKICYLFSIHRKKITTDYRIFIDNVQADVIEENNERWNGTINISVRQFEKIPENIT